MTNDRNPDGPQPPLDRRRESQIIRGEFRTLTSRELFGRETEIGIEHQGSLYRLRITRQGKLILNK